MPISVQSFLNSATFRSTTATTATTVLQLKNMINAVEGVSTTTMQFYIINTSTTATVLAVNANSLGSYGVTTSTVIYSSNNISSTSTWTKQQRQLLKLDLAQLRRKASGVTTSTFYRLRNTYITAELPTTYISNTTTFNNTNTGGLIVGRPWGGMVDTNMLVNLDANRTTSYAGTGTIWYDISGGNRNATLYNTSTFTSTATAYFSFNKNNLQYADIPTLGNLPNWSFEVWFRVTTSLAANEATAVVCTVFDVPGVINYGQINFGLISGAGALTYSNTLAVAFFNGAWRACATFTPVINQWYCVTGTYDGTTLRQYINGVLDNSLAYTGVSSANGGPVRIARRWDGPASAIHYFPGDVSVVRIYNSALNAEQVLGNYTGMKAKFGY